MSRKNSPRLVATLDARLSDMRAKVAAAGRAQVEREAAFRRLHDRRHALLDVEHSGAKLTAEQAAELTAVHAQIDVLEAADAITRGEFKGQHERAVAMAKVAREMYAALRSHEGAVTGDVFDRIRFEVMKREHAEVLAWLERVTAIPGAWLTPREHFDIPGDGGGCRCPLHEARACTARLKFGAAGEGA